MFKIILAIAILFTYQTNAQLAVALPNIIVPTAGSTVPSCGVANGTAGSAGTFLASDAAPKLCVQKGNLVINSDCTWSITFAQPFISSSPVVIVKPIIPTGDNLPIDCNASTPGVSNTAASGKCWRNQNTLLSLSIVTSGLNVIAAQNSVCPTYNAMWVAGEPTQ